MQAKKNSPSGFMEGLILGFFLGLLLAFLFSPERMRRLRERLKELGERGRRVVEEAVKEGREIAAESEKWF